MQYISDISDLKLKNSIVTLGKFDGNHLGHRLLFGNAVSLKEPGDSVVIFTFNIQPMTLISGHKEKTIVSAGERSKISYPEGVDMVIEFPFTEKARQITAEDFVKDILVDKLGIKAVVCGNDFRFGKDRLGTPELLRELGEKYGFDCVVFDKLQFDGADISSTAIKAAIEQGRMSDVKAMMGQPYSISGTIKKGKSLGRTLGFPTINMDVPEDKVLPPRGVYATKTVINGQTFSSISNIGVRPTVEDGAPENLETYIIDFQGDIYGEDAEVFFLEFIRSEKKFDSVEDLKKQVLEDINKVINKGE